jgi:hypothetical protein
MNNLGVIPPLIHLAKNGTTHAKIESMYAIGIMARTVSVCRTIFDNGGVEPIMSLLVDANMEAKMQVR